MKAMEEFVFSRDVASSFPLSLPPQSVSHTLREGCFRFLSTLLPFLPYFLSLRFVFSILIAAVFHQWLNTSSAIAGLPYSPLLLLSFFESSTLLLTSRSTFSFFLRQ